MFDFVRNFFFHFFAFLFAFLHFSQIPFRSLRVLSISFRICFGLVMYFRIFAYFLISSQTDTCGIFVQKGGKCVFSSEKCVLSCIFKAKAYVFVAKNDALDTISPPFSPFFAARASRARFLFFLFFAARALRAPPIGLFFLFIFGFGLCFVLLFFVLFVLLLICFVLFSFVLLLLFVLVFLCVFLS